MNYPGFGAWFIIAVVIVILSCNVVYGGDVKVSLTRKSRHGYVFVDNAGRTRIFHGVNAVYKLPPWIPSTEGWDHNSTLSEEDAKNLTAWGFNVVRLGVMWPGAYPKRDSDPSSYLQKVKEVVDVLGKYGIYTILDMHQDLAGRTLCGEGVPDWAINTTKAKRPFPQPVVDKNYSKDSNGYPVLKDCLQEPFFHYYFTDAVCMAFENLYKDFKEDFARFWGEVAKTFAGSKTVLGYELINEPWAGDVKNRPSLYFPGSADRENLYLFYEKANHEIRKYDQNSIVFIEKSLTNILGPLGFYGIPGGSPYRDRTAFSWHNYCGSVDRNGDPDSASMCRFQQGVQLSQSYGDVKYMDCGSFMTEFGAVSGNSTAAIDVLNWLLDEADVEQQSWAYWQYKSYNDITTASNALESFYWTNGTLQKNKVDALSRVYAQAVAGAITNHQYDRENKKFSLSYRMLATVDGSGTVIYIAPLMAEITANDTRQINVTITPKGFANATFSNDTRFLYVNHIGNSWKEGDELDIEVFISSATIRYVSSLLLLCCMIIQQII